MKVLAFAASNSKQSINKQLAIHASSLIEGAEVELLDINDYEMPLYSADREQESGIPDLAHAFYKKIGSADALLISYAEHNGTFTAAYKNLYDWASRIDMKVYQDKPMVMLSASPGPGGGTNVIGTAKMSAPYFGGDVVADFSVANFYDNFDMQTGKLSNAELQSQLVEAVSKLTA